MSDYVDKSRCRECVRYVECSIIHDPHTRKWQDFYHDCFRPKSGGSDKEAKK